MILRDGGELDDWGYPTQEEVYSGECHYQQGVRTNSEVIQRKSILFIKGAHKLNEGDNITVTTATDGHMHSGTIKTVRNIKLPITQECVTEVEIIQDTEKRRRRNGQTA